MDLSYIIAMSFIPFGILCIIYPFLVLMLFPLYSVLSFTPTLSKIDAQFKMMQIGTMNIYLSDFLILIMSIVFIKLVIKAFNSDKQLLLSMLKSKISLMVIFFFSWNCFIGALSYIKGFQIQNVLRLLSPELTFLFVLSIPLMKNIETKKKYYYEFTIYMALLLVLFAVMRYYVTNEVEFTSSGTKRTLLDFAIILFILPMCYMLFYSESWKNRKISLIIMVLFFAIGVGLTGHRSGWIVYFFILSLCFISPKFDRKQYLWVPFFCLSLIILLILFFPYIKKTYSNTMFNETLVRVADIFNMQNRTTEERLSKWNQAFDTLKTDPLLGLGRMPVNAVSIDRENNGNLTDFFEFNRDTHNLIANKIAHEGLIGTSVLIVFLFFILKQVNRLNFYDAKHSQFIMNYMLSFLLLCMFNPTFDSFSGKTFFYIFIGILNSELLIKEELPYQDRYVVNVSSSLAFEPLNRQIK